MPSKTRKTKKKKQKNYREKKGGQRKQVRNETGKEKHNSKQTQFLHKNKKRGW